MSAPGPSGGVGWAATRAEDVPRSALVARATTLLAGGHRLALIAAHDDGPAGFRVVYLFAGRKHPADPEPLTLPAEPATPTGSAFSGELGKPTGSAAPADRHELVVRIPRDEPWVPSLAALSFPAGRFERAIRDQFGIEPDGHPRPVRLVHHAHWPDGWYPMRRDAPQPAFGPDEGGFAFVPVEGAGVYEIPVGPVHAGMIEPGHFRFSVVGETIVRMKARLWFVHRGVERLAQGRTPQEGLELAVRIAGDTTVGHGLAYAMAVEAALGLAVREEDRLVRALLLELERLYQHVADLGALANDVGFGIVNVHAQRLRERLLRVNRAVTGHRLLRGGVQVGGAGLLALPPLDEIAEVAAQVAELVALTLDSSVVLDRFTGTAVLGHDEAAAMGVLGYVARASGVDVDARRDHPFVDLGPRFAVCTADGGDVLARHRVRADEVQVSAALVADLVARLDGRLGTGTRDAALSSATGARDPLGVAAGSSFVEAWRGTVCHRVELDAAGRIGRLAIVDPSFFTWPALPVALADTIVPDFPLANKSFDCSYAGNDL